jgi:hypothetical protein
MVVCQATRETRSSRYATYIQAIPIYQVFPILSPPHPKPSVKRPKAETKGRGEERDKKEKGRKKQDLQDLASVKLIITLNRPAMAPCDMIVPS